MTNHILIGILFFMAIDVLMQPGEALSWWRVGLFYALTGSKVVDIDRLQGWRYVIFKLLAWCSKCLSCWASIAFSLTHGGAICPVHAALYAGLSMCTSWGLSSVKNKFWL
jgi:hypothetical protein